MLNAILTPLRARFDASPRLPSQQTLPVEPTPEDIARDVLVQLMKNSVERLKVVGNGLEKVEVLSEVHRIMLEDTCTKDAFRESDGFLAVMSSLTSLAAPRDLAAVAPEDQVNAEVLEGARLVFMIISEAMHEDEPNSAYFKNHVGYDLLSQALRPFMSQSAFKDHVLGFLFSLSLHDFSVSSVFMSLRDGKYEDLDRRILQLEPRLGLIAQPSAMRLLLDLLPDISSDPVLHYVVYKLLERLTALSHRNKVVLSDLGIFGSLFRAFLEYKVDRDVPSQERRVMQKLLRRVLDLGASPEDVRILFRAAVNDDGSLNSHVLEILRAGMKARWPDHFSFERRAAIKFSEDALRGLPPSGFTLLMWLFVERYPSRSTQNLFTFRSQSRVLFSLKLRVDGKLEIWSSAHPQAPVVVKTPFPQGRWTHVVLTHRPHRGTDSTLRLFIDGILVEVLNWGYPKYETSAQTCTYLFGEDTDIGELSWCMASAIILSQPLPENYPRLVQYLGPRYGGTFQSHDLVKFLTYEAATGLNVFLSSLAGKTSIAEANSLVKAINSGLGVDESSIVFSATPAIVDSRPRLSQLNVRFSKEGDVVHAKAQCIDLAMWRVGGTAIALKLVEFASTPHELSRTLGILTDGLRSSWRNSEDMERMRGYDVLSNILRKKSTLINVTAYETIFELIGINFRTPEQSIIQNAMAYQSIALDFELWSHTREEIQRQHLEHFSTLLVVSRYKRFNARQRLPSTQLTKQLLFVWQTNWYSSDTLPYLLLALRSIMEATFTSDKTIKPVVSYLAANLFGTTFLPSSPLSIMATVDSTHKVDKAERLFEVLVNILSTSKEKYRAFSAALPLTRVFLLLLGVDPTPVTAEQVLNLIAVSIDYSFSFVRKFELVSGWTFLKAFVPSAWCGNVQAAAFRILFGRYWESKGSAVPPTVVCPNIFVTILAALDRELPLAVSQVSPSALLPEGGVEVDHESVCSSLMESLIQFQASSSTFRELFKSQQVTQAFVQAFKAFINALSASGSLRPALVSILDKLKHFGLTLALDNAVSGAHKRELLNLIQSSETLVDSSHNGHVVIDPSLVTDRRSLARRLTSTRLSLQLGERTLSKNSTRVNHTRSSIAATEAKRLRKNILDLREDNREKAELLNWDKPLLEERGLWERSTVQRHWQLDETEGPNRVRKRLECTSQEPENSKVDGALYSRKVEAPAPEDTNALRVEVPPWAESYEVSTVTDDEESRQLAEEVVDDKHRRIRHQLEPGDVIEAVTTVARVTGVDSSLGLLILGRTHLYMLDGLVEGEEGQIIDAVDAPKRSFFVPGSKVEVHQAMRAQRWTYEHVANLSERTFLFRNVALEIYFRDSRSLLVVFSTPKQRGEMQQRLSSALHAYASTAPTISRTPNPLKSPFVSRVMNGARAFSAFREDSLLSAQRRWQTRELSNFGYLCILNQLSGRTPSDATQYPVFPWVLQDYASDDLDLSDRNVFRDLTRPMGALTPARREEAQSRYEALGSVGENPFHFGTHFSSSMIVCHFLIRLAPFTSMFKTLQGGDWDLPDRLFSDIGRSYHSAACDVRGDVRELIPEFFTLPEFLENLDNLDFGILQNTGERLNHVKLPPWAKDDPLLFIVMHRRALESNYVSENLHSWIDLIWGCKQRDPDSLNVYHPLSYEGSIDLDAITDELEREATVGIIHNFGQTPRKLYTAPHPPRIMHGMSTLPLGTLHGVEEDSKLLKQGAKPAIRSLPRGTAVKALIPDPISERIVAHPAGIVSIPSFPDEHVEWGFSRTGRALVKEIRVVVDGKVVQVEEDEDCTCATFSDSESLITGSRDFIVRMWRVTRASHGGTRIALTHLMRVHSAEISCVAASRPWSIVVSGSKDGSAAIWDLNRATYIRSIMHGDGIDIHLAAVNESTGYIATCSREKLWLHTVNARPIAMLDLSQTSRPRDLLPAITSMAFLEREYSRLGVLATGTLDGKITLRTWNADRTPKGERAQWEFETLHELQAQKTSAITALRFVGEELFHGDSAGQTYAWSLPD